MDMDLKELIGYVEDILDDYADKPALGFEAIRILVKGYGQGQDG